MLLMTFILFVGLKCVLPRFNEAVKLHLKVFLIRKIYKNVCKTPTRMYWPSTSVGLAVERLENLNILPNPIVLFHPSSYPPVYPSASPSSPLHSFPTLHSDGGEFPSCVKCEPPLSFPSHFPRMPSSEIMVSVHVGI